MMPAKQLLKSLSAALHSVARIEVEQRAFASVWVITPDLLIVPSFVTSTQANVGKQSRVKILREEEPAWSSEANFVVTLKIKLVSDIYRSGDSIEVWRLKTPMTTGLLARPELDIVQPGSMVALIGHPNANRDCHISFGEVHKINEDECTYRITSGAGTAGGPLLNQFGRVIGVHLAAQRDSEIGQGVHTPAILRALREHSSIWNEVASFHSFARLSEAVAAVVSSSASSKANTANTMSPPSKVLLRAAARHGLKASTLSEQERSELAPLVSDTSAETWVMTAKARQDICRKVGDVKTLRQYTAPDTEASVADRVIRTILAGPPYKLQGIPLEELSWWISACRWFSEVPGLGNLPSPNEISRVLEKRRSRERLTMIAGNDFVGRLDELNKLERWFKASGSGSIVVSGVGGMGKSALVAKFASTRDAECPLIWLDFDRADLAADDAPAVLRVLCDQLSVAYDNFVVPTIKDDDWSVAADAVGKFLSESVSSKRALIVLDSFEVAQFLGRFQEIVPLLERIANAGVQVKTLVASRAPVSGFVAFGASSESIDLKGLSSEDALKWLNRRGIGASKPVKAVVEQSGGLPLAMRLLERLKETKGSIPSVPDAIRGVLVVGFLNERILDRVMTAALRPVARGAIVLRRLNVQMIAPVLGHLPEMPKAPAEEWFENLAREASLFEGSGVLTLRPELRSSALKLLEIEDKDLVTSIDRKAAAWYSSQSDASTDPDLAAELVYHRLRLGDVKGAEAAWIDGCSGRLKYAADDLANDAKAAKWLRSRLGVGEVKASEPTAWQSEASERIVSSRQRGVKRAAKNILSENVFEKDNSELVFHEAYEIWQDSKNPNETLQYLDSAGLGGERVAAGRAVLAAAALLELGRVSDADARLHVVMNDDYWKHLRGGTLLRFIAASARMRMASDVRVEVELSSESDNSSDVEEFSQVLFLTPALQRAASRGNRAYSNADAGLPQVNLLASPHDMFYAVNFFNERKNPELSVDLIKDIDVAQIPSTYSELQAMPRRSKSRLHPELRRTLDVAARNGMRRWLNFANDPASRGLLANPSTFESLPPILTLSALLAWLPLFTNTGISIVLGNQLYTPIVGRTSNFLSTKMIVEYFRKLLHSRFTRDMDFILTQAVGADWLEDTSTLLKRLRTNNMFGVFANIFRSQSSVRNAALVFHVLADHPLPLLVRYMAGDNVDEESSMP